MSRSVETSFLAARCREHRIDGDTQGADGSISRQLRVLLASGGDSRIWPDPASGRNRYGTPIGPASGEIWLSSSTASAVSQSGFETARACLESLFHRAGGTRLSDLFDGIRRRIASLYGIPGSEVILAPSGTDAELITLAIATGLIGEPLCNIVVAPEETGSGVMMAAGGANFLDSASFLPSVAKGARLAGWETAEINAAPVCIRLPDGRPRRPRDIDAEVARLAEDALARGRNVLLHVLDTSKTGLSGLSRTMAAEIAASAPDRVLVVVDACQLRCSAETLRSDLKQGFMVQITGSKFAGGPPFCGALLLPGAVADRFAECTGVPGGLAGYSALLDWPDILRSGPAACLTQTANIGLALRWSAVLADLQHLETVDEPVRRNILERFDQAVGDILGQTRHFARLDDAGSGAVTCKGLVPLVVQDHGRPGSFEMAVTLHERLRRPANGPAIHLGQAVALGPLNVLRVCASAQHVVSVAERMHDGDDLETAISPALAEIEAVSRELAAVGA